MTKKPVMRRKKKALIERVAHAEPTKEFFVFMLTRDIPLSRAILDLIDNCVDGAKRSRGRNRYTGLEVAVKLSPSRFEITDNCGGIPVKVAESYAFRFGRPRDVPLEDGSLGQFGVGMKRAFFKLGNKFRVESRTATERFVIDVDVREWRKDPDPEWHFTFSELQEGLPKARRSERGTRVVVTDLHDAVKAEFQLGSFLGDLKDEIETAHQNALSQDLKITLNELELRKDYPALKASREIYPAVYGDHAGKVRYRLYAGIGDPEPEHAGWSVYCNGRMVLNADKSRGTGWGDGPPRFHPQYNMFRGYVFLESSDSSALPWNTTKTGVDGETGIFRRVRREMIRMTVPVTRFLNRLDKAKTQGDEWLPNVVERARYVDLRALHDCEVFKQPDDRPYRADVVTIKYARPEEQVKAAMSALKVRSRQAVGEKTFDYFYERVCEDR